MAKTIYKALADPTRRKILQLLRQRDLNAGEISEHFDFAKPTLSRHFSVLREADLIISEKDGNHVIYSLNISVLEEAILGMMDMFQIELGENGNDDVTKEAIERSVLRKEQWHEE